MTTTDSTEEFTPVSTISRDGTAVKGEESGWYMTDGEHLFRLVGLVRGAPAPGLAEVEDCLSLDVSLVPLDELRRRKLQRVKVRRFSQPAE